MKKTALRELQNDNILNSPISMRNSSLKDSASVIESKVSGSKRPFPEWSVQSPSNQPPCGNAANSRVYVRRKCDGEVVKGGDIDNTNINFDFLRSAPSFQGETLKMNQIIEPKSTSFPTVVPFPVSTSVISSGKPSVELHLGKSSMNSASSELRADVLSSPLDGSRCPKAKPWEERYHHLQQVLRNIEQSDQKDYIEMLRSLSSAELSIHAVELEKRSIRISLEEAKEMQRVAALNVLKKSTS